MKVCSNCGRNKNYTAFAYSGTTKDGHEDYCKVCKKTVLKIQKARATKATQLAHQSARWHAQRPYLRDYGITLEDYKRLLEAQGGVCAICKRPETKQINGKVIPLAVDHDHVTKLVRGLLCARCNTGIGQFEDNVDFLLAAADYLIDAFVGMRK